MALEDMESVKLPRGFKTRLDGKLEGQLDESEIILDSIKLQSPGEYRRTRQRTRNFPDVRIEILKALQHFLNERFKIDDEVFDKIEPFIRFFKDAIYSLNILLFSIIYL